MLYPVGSILKVKKADNFIKCVVAGIYPLREEKYALIPVNFDKVNVKYRIESDKPMFSSTGEDIVDLENIYCLNAAQVKSLINSAGSDGDRFWQKMIEEYGKYEEELYGKKKEEDADEKAGMRIRGSFSGRR